MANTYTQIHIQTVFAVQNRESIIRKSWKDELYNLKNIFATGELVKLSVVAKNATTAADGKTYDVEYFNLDAILSVGYRVNSKRGTQFLLIMLPETLFYGKIPNCAYASATLLMAHI